MKQLDHVRRILWILAGNTAYALAVTMFILPNGLITGGTTGLALFFYHQMGLPIQAFVTVFNVAMFLLGAVVLGRTFALTTIISTFYYPLILSVFQKIPALGKVTDDNLLAVIFAGLLIGGGIGVVIRAGASTGGMDIPPLVLHKKLGLPVSGTMNTMDTAILLLQIVFSDKEKVLYGILLVLIYTSVLNKVLLLGQAKMQVKIVTERYEEVNQAIASELDRGGNLISFQDRSSEKRRICGHDRGQSQGAGTVKPLDSNHRSPGIYRDSSGQRGAGKRVYPGKKIQLNIFMAGLGICIEKTALDIVTLKTKVERKQEDAERKIQYRV